MTKFTPGKWAPEYAESINVRAPDGSMVALCTNLTGRHAATGRRDTNEVEANAHLIAAAPDLYAALKKAASVINDVFMDKMHAHPAITLEFVNEINAALAKARGQL